MTVRVKRRRGITRLSSKHQVTIPVEAVREAGLQVGDEFRVLVDEEKRIVLVREVDPITRFAGSLTYPPGYLEALRNEWERDQPAADLEDSEADDAVST